MIIYDTVSYRYKAMKTRPQYAEKDSPQTLREGLAEYYALNPHITPPETQPSDFATILKAHDVLHVIYGCDTGMYDELRLLPLSWWTSDCTFARYQEMRKTPAVDVMYEDMIREKGVLWLYTSVLKVLPALLPTVIALWFKTRNHRQRLPFLEFEALLDRPLLEIRQAFDVLALME